MRSRAKLIWSVAVCLLLVSCGVPGGEGTNGAGPGTAEHPGTVPDLDDQQGEDDPLLRDLPADPEFVEVNATGPIEGEFETFPRCFPRNDDGGEYLHVFFAFFDESTDEIPSIDVVMRIRPPDHAGDIHLFGGDVEVEYRHADFSNQELLDATVGGRVGHAETDAGLPLALVEFDGSYSGNVGVGTFSGRLSCLSPPG